MKLITTLSLIISVTCVVTNAASVGNAQDAGGFLQDPHIIGGVPATHHKERPQVFHISFHKGATVLKTCIGTEITVRPEKVLWLTAAECVETEDHSHFVIEFMSNGRLLHLTLHAGENGRFYKIHPKYNSASKENNIAAITTPTRIQHGDDVILETQLPEKGDLFDSKAADIYLEWKTIGKDTDTTDKYQLNSIRTKVIKPTWCSIWYPFSPIKGNHVCASGWYGKGFLKDDVGIPLLVKERDAWKLTGIATGVRPWTHWLGLPIEFLSIDPYLEWIHGL